MFTAVKGNPQLLRLRLPETPARSPNHILSVKDHAQHGFRSKHFTFRLPPPRLLCSNSPDAFPRLMHINPAMSGPVTLRRTRYGLAPGAIAFAGAEFVVVGKSVIGVEEIWEVVAEVRSRLCAALLLFFFYV